MIRFSARVPTIPTTPSVVPRVDELGNGDGFSQKSYLFTPLPSEIFLKCITDVVAKKLVEYLL
jgi:hypothetical protein